MNEFLQTVLTFPTVVFSGLLAVSVVYWLLASTGLADGDAVGGLLGGDGDAGFTDTAAAMLSRLGLAGVPATVVFTTFAFAGWLGTYFVQLLALGRAPEDARTLAGIGTLLAVIVLAVAATAIVLRPLARVMSRLSPAETSLLGLTAVIVTPTLTSDYGQAAVDDGGAGLILQVRYDDPHPLQRGDRIVLIEYLEGQNAYRVVSEQQFLSR